MHRRLLAPLLTVGIAATALLGTTAPASAATSGCAANGGAVPAGATTAAVPDVDGDGRRDVEFVTETLPGGGHDYGVLTASGHLSRLHETLPGPGGHGGWTARIVHGTVVTVVDDGRSALLYTFRGCAFHPVRNAQGRQYAFSIAGYTGAGTGVACVARRGRPWLFGEQATRSSGERWDVTRTHVVVGASGPTARNGVRETVGTRLPYADRKVGTAFGSSCGAVPRVRSSGD